jgi:serine/threonine-protein kinase
VQAQREVIFQPGTLFHGRYRIVRCLKAGGMGAVYEVVDEKTAGSRALKVMLPDLLENEGLRARFALEARITGGIESDYIVRTFDAGVDDATGTPFLVMDLLRGEDLGALLKRRKCLSASEVATYLFQAARALDKTHAAGIVHRDLKPDNLFLTFREDGSPCVKILDFGIAKVTVAPDPLIKTRPMMGTPLYMSPEQVRNERTIGAAADIYAIGHITYTLLVGESYWADEADNISSPYLLIAEVMRGPQEPPSARALRRCNITLPAAFDPWFLKATALSAESRFDRASATIHVLGEALGVPLPNPPPSLPDAFNVAVTNPSGSEHSIPGDGPTAELAPSGEGERLRAIDTPTVITAHSRPRPSQAALATTPSEPGTSRSQVEQAVTGVEGPSSAPAAEKSSLQVTKESPEGLAATGQPGKMRPRATTSPIPIHDRPSAIAEGHARTPPLTPTQDKLGTPPLGRHRPVPPPPPSSQDRFSPAVSRDKYVPPSASQDKVSTPSSSRTPSVSRDRSPPPPSVQEPSRPLAVPREKTSIVQPNPLPVRTGSQLSSPAAQTRPNTLTPVQPNPLPVRAGSQLSRPATQPRPNTVTREGAAMKTQAFRFQITADQHRHILRLKVWGFWTMDEAKAYWDEFQAKARPLFGTPWYVLADIADFPPQKGEVTELVGKTMNFARTNGMVRAANLVSSALSKMHIARMSAEMGLPAYSFFSSEMEAITWLLQG